MFTQLNKKCLHEKRIKTIEQILKVFSYSISIRAAKDIKAKEGGYLPKVVVDAEKQAYLSMYCMKES